MCDDGGVALSVVGAAVELTRVDGWIETEYRRKLVHSEIKSSYSTMSASEAAVEARSCYQLLT
jgi:hypothetical protein